jgi:hypothetical protein
LCYSATCNHSIPSTLPNILPNLFPYLPTVCPLRSHRANAHLSR